MAAIMHFDENRTFGIEIEAYNVLRNTVAQALCTAGIPCSAEEYSHTRRAHWKVVTDRSISGADGFELVSPPLRGAEGLEEIRKVTKVLAKLGAKVNKSCGMHVHHDSSGFGVPDVKNFIRLYARVEESLDEVMPESRRGNSGEYCRSIRSKFISNADFARRLDACMTIEQIRDLIGDRYQKVNLHAWWRHGTIEIRHHGGTIDAEKIIAWVVYTQLLLQRSLRRVRAIIKSNAERSVNTYPRYTLCNDLGIYATLKQCGPEVQQAVRFLCQRTQEFRKGRAVA